MARHGQLVIASLPLSRCLYSQYFHDSTFKIIKFISKGIHCTIFSQYTYTCTCKITKTNTAVNFCWNIIGFFLKSKTTLFPSSIRPIYVQKKNQCFLNQVLLICSRGFQKIHKIVGKTIKQQS